MLKAIKVTHSRVQGLRPHASGLLRLPRRTSFLPRLWQPLGRCGGCELSLCRSPASFPVASSRSEVSGLEHGADEPYDPVQQKLRRTSLGMLAIWGILQSAPIIWSFILQVGWEKKASGFEHESCLYLGHCPCWCRPSLLRSPSVVQVLQMLGPVGISFINITMFVVTLVMIIAVVTSYMRMMATQEKLAKNQEEADKLLELINSM